MAPSPSTVCYGAFHFVFMYSNFLSLAFFAGK